VVAKMGWVGEIVEKSTHLDLNRNNPRLAEHGKQIAAS